MQHGDGVSPAAIHNLPHAREVDERRAVDTHKVGWIEGPLECTKAVVSEVTPAADVEACVVVSTFDPIDVLDRDDRERIAAAHCQP